MLRYLWILVTSIAVSIILGFLILPILKKLKAGQSILSYVKEHKSKEGTPTMGGCIFVVSAVFTSLVFCKVSEMRSVIVLCAFGVAYCIVGFLDDFIKVKYRKNEGLKPYQKILFQGAIAIIASIYMYVEDITNLYLPFTGNVLNLGWWIVPFAIFVFIATTNCVNLVDGLDGLAGGVCYVFLSVVAVIILIQTGWDAYNGMVTVCVALVGSLLGFLLFNTNKASVFMGDTGSLSLGGFIAVICLFSKNALYIPIVGIAFVVTGLSVVLQVAYFKKTGRRIFLMSPLHHHLQMKGISEGKIAFVYKLLTLVLGLFCIIGLGGQYVS